MLIISPVFSIRVQYIYTFLDDPYHGTSFVPAHIAVLASFLMAIGVFLMAGGFRFFIITVGMVGFVTGGKDLYIMCFYY